MFKGVLVACLLVLTSVAVGQSNTPTVTLDQTQVRQGATNRLALSIPCNTNCGYGSIVVNDTYIGGFGVPDGGSFATLPFPVNQPLGAGTVYIWYADASGTRHDPAPIAIQVVSPAAIDPTSDMSIAPYPANFALGQDVQITVDPATSQDWSNGSWRLDGQYMGGYTYQGTLILDLGSGLTAGTHTLTIETAGTPNYTASTKAFPFTIQGPGASTPSLTCVPSTITSGETVSCSVSLPAGASSPVSFAVGGAAWTAASPNPSGTVTVNAALNEVNAGSYTIAYSYPGDGGIPALSGTAQVTVNAVDGTQTSNTLYQFSITGPGSTSGYSPNSNVIAYSDSVNGTWSLGYDSLNRLTSSTQVPLTASTRYGCWNYDSFGNILTQALSDQPLGPSPGAAACQLSASANTLQSSYAYLDGTNHITTGSWLDSNNSQHTGSPAYDQAGNLTNDLAQNYLYDAEGRVCAVQWAGSGVVVGYLYDAEGHRVAKGMLPSMTCDPALLQVTNTYFIGPDDQVMTEVDSQGTWVRTEVSAAGQYLATYKPDGIHYPISDWLGTKRLQVNPNQASNSGVEDTCLSQPFGDQLVCSASALDASPRHFTGKERDTESGLDYFGARYYSSNMGRWMSPDWADKPEAVPYSSLDNPQTLNLYGYVGNNPLSHADPNGHCDANGQNCSVWDHVAGAVGGVLNLVPDALNLGVSAANHFLSPGNQLDSFQRTEPDAHASSSGMTTGVVASFAIPIGGEAREGTWLAGQIGNVESRVGNILTKNLTEETLSAASREASGGMGVAKAGGGSFDHVGKVEQAMNGLNRQITHAEGLLQRSGLSEGQTAALTGQIERARAGIARAAEAIKPKLPQ